MAGLYAESPPESDDKPAIRKPRGRPKAKREPKLVTDDKPKAKRKQAEVKIGSDGQIVLTERDEQRLVVVYCQKKNIPFYAIPNAARRSFWEAREAKLSGVMAGVCDLCITRASKGYHGLYIEMKRREGGVVSESQQRWLALLNAEGYLAVIAEGATKAFTIIEDYLGDRIGMLQTSNPFEGERE